MSEYSTDHVGTGVHARSGGAALRDDSGLESRGYTKSNGTGGKVYVLEVNPRASRTVPYVSKATGIPMAKIASRLMTGRKLREFLPEFIDQRKDLDTGACYYVKSPVFPWNKFPGVDTVLGPEMKSTGEVMGVADNFGEAFAKAQIAAGQKLPTQGTLFISVTDHDKPHVAEVARKFVDMGFKLVATAGTADVIEAAGMACVPTHSSTKRPFGALR
jgi:carbamoyl-phosphate synthase large subunit